jgi:putative DNA primase/helicase
MNPEPSPGDRSTPIDLQSLQGQTCPFHADARIVVARSGQTAICKAGDYSEIPRCNTEKLRAYVASLNLQPVSANGAAQDREIEILHAWRDRIENLAYELLKADREYHKGHLTIDMVIEPLATEIAAAIKSSLWDTKFAVYKAPDALTPVEIQEAIDPVIRRAWERFRTAARNDLIVLDSLDGQRGRVTSASGGAAQEGPQWADPKAIDTELLPVPPFDSLLLPPALRPWLADIAERSQCPPDFLAVGAIVVCASQVARRLAIRPKRQDDWTVIPNLWGGVIAPPGFLKSPALAETLKPLRRLAHEAALRFEDDLRSYETESVVRKAQRDNIEQAIRAAIKKDKSANLDGLRGELAELVSEPPHEARTLVNDTTVEMLGSILNQNSGGVLIFRDELSGFLRSLERQGHEADRAFYCEAWNGSGRFTYDRIGRGTIHIARTCVSILGGIQPGPWRSYLREAFQDGRDDGFVSRFQMLVWPNVSRSWRNVDRWPDTAARETAWRVFSALDNLETAALGAEQPEGCEIAFLRFAPDAQALFDEWRSSLEAKLRRDDEHPILVSHLAKYRKLMPALALVLHAIACVEGSVSFGGAVSLTAATQAAAWTEFLEAHARRSYQSATDATNTAAAALATKVRGGKLTNPFRARDLYRSGWEGLSDRDDAYRAIDGLEEAHWLRREELSPENGRPSIQFWINPKVREASK